MFSCKILSIKSLKLTVDCWTTGAPHWHQSIDASRAFWLFKAWNRQFTTTLQSYLI